MSARYRLVHFVPDPFLGGRVPIAAILEHGGRISVTKMPHLPGPRCLGGRSAAALVGMMLEDLDGTKSFDRLPMGVGPYAYLDTPRGVPAGVGDVPAWLAAHLRGESVADPEQEPEGGHVVVPVARIEAGEQVGTYVAQGEGRDARSAWLVKELPFGVKVRWQRST